MDTGTLLYLISLATMIGLYAILTLGLNLQWGFAGLFNAGIAGFFAVGAYTTSILTTPESAETTSAASICRSRWGSSPACCSRPCWAMPWRGSACVSRATISPSPPSASPRSCGWC